MPPLIGTDRDLAWNLLLAAARHAERVAAASAQATGPRTFGLGPDGELHKLPATDPDALLNWHPELGWQSRLTPDNPTCALLDLYLPICSATPEHPLTLGHLGQSLDGFIATHSGESRWVTGPENIVHLHRLRALCDAVIVGAGTVAADDPQLTTRLVPGPNPLRVVLDPTRRLDVSHRLFNDADADTLYACARSLVAPGEQRFGRAHLIGLEDRATLVGGVDLAAIVAELRRRHCTRVFVEGGGVTVSMFLQAGLLDRLHVAVAPLIIGDGKPAIRLTPRAALGDCYRPRYRVFRMGGDILFDCELGTNGDEGAGGDGEIARII